MSSDLGAPLLGIASAASRGAGDFCGGLASRRAPLLGVLDAGGNALYLLASRAGRMDLAAVLSSMYPASTLAVAALLLRERVSRGQGAGVAALLAAVALIAG